MNEKTRFKKTKKRKEGCSEQKTHEGNVIKDPERARGRKRNDEGRDVVMEEER